MERLTQETFAEAIKDDKVVIFIHRPGCSNCAKMKPQIEELAKEQPDVKVYDIEVIEDSETKLPEKWIFEILPRNITYPIVPCYSKGKKIFMTGAIFPVNILTIPFLEKTTLQSDYMNTIIITDDIKRQHGELIQAINFEQQSRMAVLRRMAQIENDIPEDDWELPTPTLGEDGKKACDACQ